MRWARSHTSKDLNFCFVLSFVVILVCLSELWFACQDYYSFVSYYILHILKIEAVKSSLNLSSKNSQRIPKKFPRFWKYPIFYIALRGRKPFWACFFLNFRNRECVPLKILITQWVIEEKVPQNSKLLINHDLCMVQ